MYKRIAAIFFPITAIALIAVGVWGYQENQEKNSVLIKAENQYQRAFHDLNNHVNKLQEEMGKTLAVNSRKQMQQSMTNVWRLAYAAQEDVGQLPMTLMPFDKAEEFVANIGRFSYEMGVRDLEKKPLNAQERKTLKTLYNHSHDIRENLNSVQEKVLSNHLRWMDVELAMATEDKNLDNTIIDGFKKVNKTVEQYPEVDWGPTVNNLNVQMKGKYKKMHGKKATPTEIKEKTRKLFGYPSTKGMKVSLNKKGDYQTYSVTIKEGKKEVNADWTAIQGHLAWMMMDRPWGKNKITYKQADQKATSFAKKLGFGEMKVISYDQTENSLSFQMVKKIGNVLVYPEVVSMKIALDNAEVIGVQADDYLFNHVQKINTKPTINEQQARKKLQRSIKVSKSNLAYINNQSGTGVLCYEFLGKLDDQKYRIFINAKTGEEEMIQTIEKGSNDV